MKTISLALILLLAVSLASAQSTFTPNLNLEKPAHHSPLWDTQMNANFDKIDAAATSSGLVCDTATKLGDAGARVNLCDAQLGANPGVIRLSTPGAITTQIVVSSNHILRTAAGTYSNALGERTPAFLLQDHSRMVCEPGTILQTSSNAANTDPVLISSFNNGTTANLTAPASTDIRITGECHLVEANPNVGTSLLGIMSLWNVKDGVMSGFWCDGIKSLCALIGGSSITGNTASNFEIANFKGNGNSGGVGIACINCRNGSIHDWTWHNSGATVIDIEPNAATDYAQNIDISRGEFDGSDSIQNTYGITVQAGASPQDHQGNVAIHDISCFGSSLSAGTLSNLIQCVGILGGAGTVYNPTIYNITAQRTVQGFVTITNASGADVRGVHGICDVGVAYAVTLNGNVTNSKVHDNVAVADAACPGGNNPLVTIIGERNAGNSSNTFWGNSTPGGVTLNGAGSVNLDATINGLPKSTSGLNNVLSYAPGITINDGAAHLVSAAPSGTVFNGKTTLAQIAAISINGATPFSWITGAIFTGGKYNLVDANVPNLDVTWLAAQACEISGKCYYPAGTYIIGSVLALPIYRPLTPESGGTTIGSTSIGDGPGVTFIRPGFDWGAGFGTYYCGDPAGTSGNSLGRYNSNGECSGRIADMTFQSSAGNPLFSIGATTIAMDGLMWGSRLMLDNVTVAGFNHNITIVGDHTRLSRLHSFGGTTGVYYDVQSVALRGDVTFDDLRSEGASIAAIGVNPSASIAGATFNGETYLSAPIGIRAEAGSCNDLMNGVHFDALFDEFMGNALISDESGLSGGVWTDANKCRNIIKTDWNQWFQNWDNAKLWTTGGRGRRATVDAAKINLTITRISGAGASMAPTTPGAGPSPIATFYVTKASVDGFSGSKIRGDIYGWISQSGTLPLMATNAGNIILGSAPQIEDGYGTAGVLTQWQTTGSYTTTNAGDCFEQESTYVGPCGWGSTVGNPTGIALQSGLVATGPPFSLVPIATFGPATVALGWQTATLGTLKRSTGIARLLTITAAGNSGTSGTFSWTASGGGCTTQPTGTFTVTGGAIVSDTITTYGRGCTSAPTLSTSASAGLTAATLTAGWPSGLSVYATTPREKGIIGVAQGTSNPGSGANSASTHLQLGSGGGIDTTADLPSGAISTTRLDVNGATTLVTGDFTIGAGWGSTASTAITLATSKDQASVTTITTGGSGIAANPTYQLTFHDGTWTQVPACIAIQTGGNDILGDFTVTSRSATAYTFQWNALPTTGKTYEVSIQCIGT